MILIIILKIQVKYIKQIVSILNKLNLKEKQTQTRYDNNSQIALL